MSSNIYLFTAPVKAGKTTTLMKWAQGKPNLGGFLAPDIENLRFLYTLRDRKLHDFQLPEEAIPGLAPAAIVNIHKFNFSATAFALARQTIIQDLRKGYDWVVIDEVGKLELKGEGLEPAVRQAVEMIKTGKAPGKLLMVVRDELVSKVIEHYALGPCRIVRLGNPYRKCYALLSKHNALILKYLY